MAKDSDNKRIEEIIEVVMKVAGGDFSAEANVSARLDLIDALSMGLNMMIDDLKNKYITDIENEKIRQLNIQLEAEKKRAEESERLKSAFLANMSHEIRTPMNGILGFAELLKNPRISSEKHEKYLEIIEKSGTRMLNIINDIIDISKLEAKLVELKLKNVNINEQLEYVHSFFKEEARNKGIELSLFTSLDNSEANITTDKEKVYSVFINLVKNALKFTETGYIEMGYQLISNNSKDELEFYVQDSGSGIHPDKHNQIFNRFVRDDEKENIEGTGLGLAISKAYVEMLGGKIWVKSTVGKGSTFLFTIPYIKATEI